MRTGWVSRLLFCELVVRLVRDAIGLAFCREVLKEVIRGHEAVWVVVFRVRCISRSLRIVSAGPRHREMEENERKPVN